MLRFLKKSIVFIIFFVILFPLSHTFAKADKKVLIFGFDGMDPQLTQKMMDEGTLPNLKKLKETGSFSPLTSSIPPQSPVAWSNFITGQNPGGHNIFDFIARHPENYIPYLSMAELEKPNKFIGLMSKPKYKRYRQGKAFWEILGQNNIKAVAIRPPSNFPPATGGGISSSGMGTPDILGGYGTYSYFTTEVVSQKNENGGIAYPVSIKNNTIQSTLIGPTKEKNKKAEIPFTIHIDTRNKMAKIVIQDNEILLAQGTWSDWVKCAFKMGGFAKAKSICRFYLKSLEPEFSLYVTPFNMDPYDPPYPISYPEDYARKVAEKIGLYYTQGMPEDSKALMNGRLTYDEYLAQSQISLHERKKMLDLELERFKTGLLYCYFSTTDAFQHMFMRCLDNEDHPGYDSDEAKKYGHIIPDIYREMDSIVGKTMEKVDKDTIVLCVSDHGFVPFRWAVNLNTWLYKEGYLKLRNRYKGESGEFFENVDWDGTKAYAIGLNSLYINLKGREGRGIVPENEKEALIKEIRRKLLSYVDPDQGDKVFAAVDIPDLCYKGKYTGNSPDFIVGYNKYYRASWATALGAAPKKIIEPNLSKWSGDHCIARDVVPGIIFTNKKIRIENPALVDIAPTVLHIFGIERPTEMIGRILF
ncbi:MAG: alkaline phosphatase family protein [bacterium]